jgi:putative ABC transport system ATP-binding protein
MVAIHNIQFAYSGSTSLEFPSFEVAQGQTCLLLGNSGSGKTTLLHLIAGFIKPTAGTVWVDEVDTTPLKGAKADAFRGKTMGFVFQKPHLIRALTVEENLLLAQQLAGGKPNRDQVKQVLDSLGVAEKAGTFPDKLSQGQAQRVTIARAVLHHPKVILADEPTSSLDDASALQVFELLTHQAARQGATLVIATHDHRLKEKVNLRISL